MANKNDMLIKRTNALSLNTPLSASEIDAVEKSLEIILPNDFKYLCDNCSYEFLYFCSFYSFDNAVEFSVISETKGWRESVNLPHNYLVLSDDGTSAILMKVEGEEECSVIWCALEDVLNICDGSPMEYNPTIFSSFTDFYEFLLDEEEKRRAEDKLIL